ncbi:MAG TPA: BTAD domain-containing putative transcriptional regulator [Pyrinomonadaceae bacterium]|jgi:ATP/maltotriose-dependent transcriptional regulator MalT/DNA-binding SARP family transcriptional activator
MATRQRRPARAQNALTPEAGRKETASAAKESPPAAPPPQQTTFFLRTKLLPPRPAPELLSRPRLTERLLSNLAHPVTLVTANAGSGKTTLVADFVRTHARSFVWYQLDHTDADPFVFLGYVAHGLRQSVPGFGDVTFSYLQQAADELARQPERAVDVLLNEVLETIEQQLILILDDYHHLGAETPVHAIVDRLLAYLPDVLHVIIISRDMPPLSLARLRSHSSLAIIDRNELLFTDEETQELFRRVFDLELTPEQLTEYRERTHGWITALQLVRQVAQRQALTSAKHQESDAPDLVEILRQSERDIFDYFAEEVFADETKDVQHLLSHISLLDRVEAGICTRLYPEANCRKVLPALVRRNVFITVASDERGEEYRLHPLFQGFLRRRFRSEAGKSGVAAEHRRFAEDYLEHGALEQALRHLLAAEDFEHAARIISEQGQTWIETGALGSLVTFAEALPRAVLEAHPRALAYRAEVARLRGEYETAAASFRRAANLLHEQGDREGEAEALHSLATIARRRGDCESAFTYLDRACELTDESSPVRIKCGNTRGLCLTATGEWTAAEREFRTALQSAEEQADERYTRLIAHNLGLPAMIRGDFGEALRWLRHMLREAKPGQPPMPQEATGHLNIARCYLYRGDLGECERHLDQALERCQLFNLIASRAETFETYGNLYRERLDAAHATEFYERAARAYDEAGIDLARSELLEEQAILKLQLGDLGGARSLLDRLVHLREESSNEMGLYTATLSRGRVRLAQGEHEAARDELLPALEYFRTHGLYYYEAQAGIALAGCDYARGEEAEMLEHLRRTLDLAARYDYDYWLRREVASHPQMFSSAEAAELLPPDVRDELRLKETPPAETGEQPQAQPVVLVSTQPVTDLTINMLGPVEIFRDPARPLGADAWTTKRARDILCFIASRRHRRASKDTIIDTFWGEADFEAVEKNFHPTVSHIRKALNSNQPLKQNFLLYRDGDYQFNPDFSYRIDIEEFERLVTEGEAARRAGQQERCLKLYEEAIALYRGEFMQGSYDEWVEEQRSYYSEQYLRMLEALASAAQKTEEWLRSLQLAQEILRNDPFREDIHCMMMRAHAGQGNRVAVKEQYENLRRLLRKELGVEPAAETQKMYRELLK